MQSVRRIGVLGGSFDPVHAGHIQTALGVGQHFNLDEVVFIPCAQHAFGKRRVVSDRHRVAMLELALESALESTIESAGQVSAELSLTLDKQELERQGVSYSVTTCEALRQQLGSEAIICLILGTDVMNQFHRWYQWRRITELVNVVLVDRAEVNEGRAGFDEDNTNAATYLSLTPDNDVAGWLRTMVNAFENPAGEVARLRLPPVACSSSQIREVLAQRKALAVSDRANDDIKQLAKLALAPNVLDYILKHDLYR